MQQLPQESIKEAFIASYKERHADKYGVSTDHVVVNFSNPIVTMQYEAYKKESRKEILNLGKGTANLYNVDKLGCK